MAKISPQFLKTVDGELGIVRGGPLLNFDFHIKMQVSLGSQLGCGAVYEIFIPGEEPR